MKKVIFLAFFLLITSFLPAQSAEKVTETLNAEKVSLAQVAYFATVYLGLGTDEISSDTALTILDEYIMFPEIKTPEEELSYEDFAYFCTRSWNIQGGAMYRMTKSPRYALRELKALGYVPPNTNPSAIISGRNALVLMTQCAEYAEANNTVTNNKIEEETFDTDILRSLR